MTTVYDIETDGLLDELTKIHVLSYSDDGKTVHHTHDYDEMREFFATRKVLVGHHKSTLTGVMRTLRSTTVCGVT